MAIPDWVVLVVIFLLIIGALILLTSLLALIINASLKKTLKNKLAKGLLHNDLNISDFKNLQFNLGLSDANVHSALLNMKSELDFGDDDGRNLLKPKLDALIREFNTQKPFSELPSKLVEPLIEARLKSSEPKTIDDLSEKITIFLKRQKRSDILIKLATYIGLFLGLIGTVSGFLK